MYTVTKDIFNSIDPLMWLIFILVFIIGIISGTKSLRNSIDGDDTQESSSNEQQTQNPDTATTNNADANNQPANK